MSEKQPRVRVYLHDNEYDRMRSIAESLGVTIPQFIKASALSALESFEQTTNEGL